MRALLPTLLTLCYGSAMTDQTLLEERIAHLQAVVDDLSDVAARQAFEIDILTRRVAMLMQREAEREVADSAGFPVADQKPPHY